MSAGVRKKVLFSSLVMTLTMTPIMGLYLKSAEATMKSNLCLQ